ncbi:glutamate-5-semialdehyde dehydrogenase [Acidiferrimicrobium sp. IK]|nr:glutamate-5-semialdehyde dehydrogenase [Acidiferrimicrobium sp. IK]
MASRVAGRLRRGRNGTARCYEQPDATSSRRASSPTLRPGGDRGGTIAIVHSLEALGARARTASRVVAQLSTAAKDAALRAAADVLEAHTSEVLAANRADLERAERADATPAVLDRLRLSESRVESMASGLRQVAALPDPVGETVEGWRRPNGLEIRKVRVPLGVVGIIYENRPNVTSDAAALCLKSGNVAFLRGSSAAITSNQAVAAALRAGYAKAGVPEDALVLVEDTSRESATAFMRMRGVIDCLVPRGGRTLIEAVIDNATVPTIIDGEGNCHVYVDASADLAMALAILVNGKTQRPSVCNATESLLVHADVAPLFLPQAAAALDGVELRGDDAARRIVGPDRMAPATDADFSAEFLDLVLSVAVVDDLDAAITHISAHGSGHTEAIVTADLRAAQRFQQEVDAAAVVVNASTRFTDGEEFGFGAEIGISTQKLHARGPMGLRELTTTKYLVTGQGQTRP